ncbi:type II toxin-antitoxin system PemK/MazF family toxin [Cellulomonas shaoxiangyii]|uniref:mRNA interferase n=1 Tax=Cellulomonas shaoxiangyii TaxID=2566013 RepID=A0A4P7SFM0_9CELL|nr:type II toxin-antitoxin system PemK/MazF family toxin [Cellulomonas shaoxiangyii]QCB92700.1 type II toxin-antitoxin system PemK/MazF family toxin [Cellulomonas shaoxiangyii]TGY85825.1 type II toxin-antitoxin system PemK/MazF family toxin [Cellulomonas shaoxiangyii]
MSRRGEVWLVDLEPARGTEADKTRPAVIVGNQAAVTAAFASGRGVVTVVPVTSNVTRVLPFQTELPAGETGLEKDSKAQAEQVRSVDVARLVEPVGSLSPRLMRELERALRLHLSL